MKTPFVTKDQLEAIAAQYPTPFHIYDEQGIRENARRLRKAFAWNPGYREYFAVKAAPTPALLKLLHEEGCGCDCSSMTELMISERCGITGENIMFSSNDTPAEEFQMADRLGAIINLDDLTLVDYLVEKSYSLTYGARNLRRLIQKELEDPMASRIIDNFEHPITQISATAQDGAVQLYTL